MSAESDFNAEAAALEAWIEAGEPGDCPMCGAGPGEAHGRGFCYGMAPQAGRPSPLAAALAAMSPEEAAEAMRPWEPLLIDKRWIRWIIADFMGLEKKEDVDLAKVDEWLEAHGQLRHFSICLDCGSERVQPLRERFEAPDRPDDKVRRGA